jgi:hypothetical protein
MKEATSRIDGYRQVWGRGVLVDLRFVPIQQMRIAPAVYFAFYNQGRPHTALDGRTPDMVYFATLPHREAA